MFYLFFFGVFIDLCVDVAVDIYFVSRIRMGFRVEKKKTPTWRSCSKFQRKPELFKCFSFFSVLLGLNGGILIDEICRFHVHKFKKH